MLDKIRHIYFLGIGGIGMSALARYFHSKGVRISGYDKTRTDLTDQLVSEGMFIMYEDDVDRLPSDIDLIVITPAIPADHQQWKWFRDNNATIKKRAEVLGMISRNTICLAVAGTHGKTTTTTMLAHFLRSSGIDCSAFLGGISANYQTNYFLGSSNVVVVEADEYDRSFLQLNPNGAILTAVDADHLDIYGSHSEVLDSYHEFIKCIKQSGYLVIKSGIDFPRTNAAGEKIEVVEYGVGSGTCRAENIRVEDGTFIFDYVNSDLKIETLRLAMPGRHNVENATAAISLALKFGGNEDGIRKGVKSFLGVHRRFEYVLKTKNKIVIDDYAHHPEELRAAISAARELYPTKRIAGVFQPHLFSRTRDFADQFASSLGLLDDVILLDIYPAREKPIEGVTSEMLINKISLESKCVVSKANLVETVVSMNFDVLLMMGAGDIDRMVRPVADALSGKGVEHV